MLKKLLRISLVSFVLLGTIAWTSFKYLGLDDDGADSLDLTLETRWPDEEIGFKEVATLTRNFVIRQFNLRATPSNIKKYDAEVKAKKLKEYARVYQDLPGKKPYGTRDVHRKTHGCFSGTVKVENQLFENLNSRISQIRAERATEKVSHGPLPELYSDPAMLGVFKPGAEYRSLVRYSNGHPLNRDDRTPDARGMAVKILRPNSNAISTDALQTNADTYLDILSINFPTFFVNEKDTARKYLKINEYFLQGAEDFSSATNGKVQEGRAILLTGLKTMEVRGALSANGSIIESPLFQEYFSMVPSRLGPTGMADAVKYFWVPEPCAQDLAAYENFEDAKRMQWPAWSQERHFSLPGLPLAKYDTAPWNSKTASKYSADYLRQNLTKNLRDGSFCYGLYFQPYRDQLSTNIEDSSDLWLRDEDDRSRWVRDIVPTYWNPTWKAYSSDRDAYLKKIQSKKFVRPVRAATLTIDKISENDRASNSQFCEDLSFNPWNGDIEHHKPLGVVSRLKRRVYNASRRTRHLINEIMSFSLERKK